MSSAHPFRFSLRTLLLAVVAVSVGTAAMVSASEWWQSAVMTITAGLLTAAILLAGFRSGASRAFWTGFAVCGCAYMLTLIVQIDNRRVADQLLPGKLLYLAVTNLHRVPSGPYGPPLPAPTYGSTPMLMPAPAPTYPVPQAMLAPTPSDDPLSQATTTTTPDSSGFGAGDDRPDQNVEPPLEDGSIPSQQPFPMVVPATSNATWSPPPTTPGTYYYPASNSYALPYAIPISEDVYVRQQHALMIGHCLWTIVFGMIGGCFAVWLHATRDKGRESVV